MSDMKLGVIESRFADIIWSHEPLSTAELINICEKELRWKRTTTYTVLKRLSERGLFQNNGGTVTSLISRDEFYSVQSELFVNETFDGSLPAFLTAFTARKNLTPGEVSEIRKLIEAYEEG
ncbi:MAG: BlaI/MecI/CopY family transcriptional regulator [Clostridiales bacterium]|nr:BlaI/MecI/CopY family transcriptional regulator [Clostridiales bacterium]